MYLKVIISQELNFFHVSYCETAKLAHVAGFEMHIGAVLAKDFYYRISFGNVSMGYTYSSAVDGPQFTSV